MAKILDEFSSLTPAVFYILLALSNQERHGYGIMKQVRIDSDERIKMGPGTLYGSIKRMVEDGLIEETEGSNQPDQDRRKYYRITPKGRKYLSAELERYSKVVKLVGKRKLAANLAV
jgi:DNA-binding PadR family transcriptional regulator